MNKDLVTDIIEWDIENWSKALSFWEKNVDIRNKEYNCLELGSRGGGLSLWLATNNNTVICSDLESPANTASGLHLKHSVQDRIIYESIDATNIGYQNKFDIVIFKSIIGGISGNGKNELKKKTIDEIYKSLKPNGQLLFAENLEASYLHILLRKKFVKWGNRWNYLKYNEIKEVFSSFSEVSYDTTGFFGAFGRNEKQRRFLGKIDGLTRIFIPKSKRYIVYGVARKS